MTVSEEITDPPGFEPRTLALELKTYRYKNRPSSSPSDTLAQLVECGAGNAKVPGLNPGWPVILFADLSFMLCR